MTLWYITLLPGVYSEGGAGLEIFTYRTDSVRFHGLNFVLLKK